MPPIISVHNLGKQYRLGATTSPNTLRDHLSHGLSRLLNRPEKEAVEEFWALRDVSFEVQEGEVLGIIGRNGAGKSTLLKILSEITEPTTGEVRVRGRVASLLEVGTGFHNELSGRENIFLNGAILGMSKAEIRSKFDEIVAFSGVEKFLDTPVKRYSSGMKVRLAFAVAAHLEPEILMIDEVLAVGDVEFQKKCLGKMGDVAKSGRTILFVSHNMAAIANLCNRGILLERGSISLSSDIDACVQQYLEMDKSDESSAVVSQYLESAAFHDVVDDNKQVSSIPMGGNVLLKVRYRCPEVTLQPKFGLVLRRKLTGEPVFGINSEMTGVARMENAGDRFDVSLMLTDLNLVHGEYVADFYLGTTLRNFEVIDSALTLRVLETDVFGTGKVPFSNTGPIYFTPQITIEEVS